MGVLEGISEATGLRLLLNLVLSMLLPLPLLPMLLLLHVACSAGLQPERHLSECVGI
jgi:hypothetical protein